MDKVFKSFIFCLIFNIIFSKALCVSYLYDTKNSSSLSSSISTVATPDFSFESEAQILMEPVTSKILYANNEEEEMLPASVTKVMTLLLLMEQIDGGVLSYDDYVTCSKNASSMGGSQIWFKEGEKITIDEALKAICVVSANDVTVAISELIGGSEDNFVIMMNQKAKELGMEHTHFMNCHGIDEDGHYTCAKDIAIMARELITKHPNILKYSSIWQDTLRNGEFQLNSTNKLIRYYDGATGLKTGYTSNAKYNLVATATRGDTTFISVILKAPSSDVRLEETKKLLDYGFSNYETKKICSSNAILDEITVNKNIHDKLQVKLDKDIYVLQNKGKNIDVDEQISYDNLKLPLNKGDKVGTITVYDKSNGEKIGESNIVADNDLKKSSLSDYIKYMTYKLFLIS